MLMVPWRAFFGGVLWMVSPGGFPRVENHWKVFPRGPLDGVPLREFPGRVALGSQGGGPPKGST